MTEREVNRIALGALRSYYRFRVKKDAPELTSDVRGAGGIIADGAYAFERDDGERFLATVEATSVDKTAEVYYRVQSWLLLWDGLAGSSMVLAIAYVVSFVQGRVLVVEIGAWLTILLLLAAVLLLTGLYMLCFRWLRRYRYIYAIEQFKRYHADEQWVAIDEAVFRGKEDLYFKELRDQCIYNGFGLLLVNEEKRPYLVVTPARRELFKNRRRQVQLFSQKQINRVLARTANVQEWWRTWSKGLPIHFNFTDPKHFFRFRRPVFNQIVICGIAWTIIGAVFWQQWQQRPVRYIDRDTYAAEVTARQSAGDPEPNRPILLSGDTLLVRPFQENVVPYLLLLQAEKANLLTTPQTNAGSDILIGMFDGALIVYDCERLYNFKTQMYMLQEAVYPDFETASRRMSALLAEGLQANMLWLGCFSDTDKRYVVYFDLLMENRVEAVEAAKRYSNQLKNKGLEDIISIKTIIPKR